MEIPSTYKVSHNDLEIEYKLIPYDEELQRAYDHDKMIEDLAIPSMDKANIKYSYAIRDLVGIKGLTIDGKEVSIEDVKQRKLPILVINLLLNIYEKNKEKLLNQFKDEAKNV